MADFAVIKNGSVINTIVADTKEIAEHITENTCVEYTNNTSVSIGYTYNGQTFTPPSA